MSRRSAPDFVDWEAYMNALYTPAPALTRQPKYDSFWRAIGGEGFGFDEMAERARRAAGRP